MTGLAWRIASVLVGIWLMAAPDLLGYAGPTRVAHAILGPIIVAAGVVAIFPATGALRWLGVPIGFFLLGVAVAFDPGLGGRLTGVVGGCLAGVLAFPPTGGHEQLGGGWRELWRDDPVHDERA